MPELPEVETIKRELATRIVGKKISRVTVDLPKMLNVPSKFFIKTVVGATIKSIGRRAKLLIINLSNGWSLLVHLKLTGQLIYGSELGLGQPHIIYVFDDDSVMKHYDRIKFGYVKLIKTSELEAHFVKEKIGPEPLDNNFAAGALMAQLKKKPNSKIKPLLMDQSIIAGIGNIYAQEACFCAHIKPNRTIKSLRTAEGTNLHRCLRRILQEAIKYKGSSIDTYVDAYGRQGGYEPRLKVYGRGGEKCLRCGAMLKAAKLAGRGTVWCPKCQK